MDEIEVACALEQVGDVERFPHLGFNRVILGITARDDAIEFALGQAIERREQGDVDSTRNERFGEQAGRQLPRSVGARRGAPADGAEHGDAHAYTSAMRRISPSSGRSQPSAGGPPTVDRSKFPFGSKNWRSVPDRLSAISRRSFPWRRS